MSPSEKILLFCSRFLPPNSSVLAAVSGGSDSVSMLCLLNEHREELKISNLAVAHVNHGLRGVESDGDEQFVRELSSSLGLQFFVKHLSGYNSEDPGIEQWARKERYRFFRSVMESGGFDFVATGHTSDDQAETVLLRILRGTGLKGLRGILPLREDGVIRPLLYVEKSELVEWLSMKGISFRTDSSNAETRFRRNSIRHKLLPALSRDVPDVIENLSSLAWRAHDSWGILSEEANKWIGRFVIVFPDQSFLLKKEGLEMRPEAGEGIKALFERNRIPVYRAHVENVFYNSRNRGKEYLLPCGWHYFPRKEGVFFVRERVEKRDFRYEIAVPGNTELHDVNLRFSVSEGDPPHGKIKSDNWSVVLDRNCCGERLLYRSISAEDRFQPLGMRAGQQVIKYLVSKGIPRMLGEGFGVIVNQSNKIVWIPGIQIDHESRVTESTRRIIRIESHLCSPA